MRNDGKHNNIDVNRQSWSETTKGNRLSANGMSLGYIAPKLVDGKPVSVLEKKDVENEISKWDKTLVVYVVGTEQPTLTAVLKFVAYVWNFISKPDIFYIEDGYFMIRCKSKEDRDMVIRSGPYFIFNAPMVIKEWFLNLSFKPEMTRLLPVWVKFPRFPLAYWGGENLSRIASCIGKTMFADECTTTQSDECTTTQSRIAFARVLIEVDVTKELLKTVDIRKEDGEIMKQRVEYEWRPTFCNVRNVFGHKCEGKGRNGKQGRQPGGGKHKVQEKQVWKEKAKLVAPTVSEICADQRIKLKE